MATVAPRRILRVPGRLCIDPTDLTLAWPHGGTGLGNTKNVRIIARGTSYPLTMEAMGGAPVEFNERGEVWGLGAFLRGWDDDAIGHVFPNTTTGATTQHKTAPGTVNATVRAGNWMSGRSAKLVFTPEGATHAKSATAPDVDAPFFILYKAIPLLAEEVEVDLAAGSEFGLDVLWMGLPDASSRVKDWGYRQDLSL